jgi:hypothetical protein
LDVIRERADHELTRLVEKRSPKGETTPDEEEYLWQTSVARYNEQRRLQARYEWHLYHTAQAERHRRTLEELIARHEQAAAELLEHEPEGEPA